MTIFDTLYQKLDKNLNDLFNKFIRAFLEEDTSTHSPLLFKIKENLDDETYRLDTNAYTVLAHASLEEYFEQIALQLVEKSILEWQTNQKVTDTLLTLIAFAVGKKGEEGKEIKLKFLEYKSDNVRERHELSQAKNQINNILGQAKSIFKNHVNENNGIALKYLMKLLIPVAIDINQNIDLMDSLDKLKKVRGEIAHKSGVVNHIYNPIECYQIVEHCKKLAEDVLNQANAKF